MKPMYDMIDGIPIWRHLKNGAEWDEVKLVATDYGKFAETLGKRILHKMIRYGGMLDKIFPNISILSTNRIRSKRKTRRGSELGDLTLEIDYKDDVRYGKKMVIFEIKHRGHRIEQNQLRKYCTMINDPGTYFKKADEVKVFFLIFDKIDTMGCSASYSIGELNKELVTKILNSSPTGFNSDVQCSNKDSDMTDNDIDNTIGEAFKTIMED